MKMKIVSVLFASVLLAALVVGCEGTPAAGFGNASGTATGTAVGHGGEISVTVTMVNGAITEVTMDLTPETPAFAAMVEGPAAAEMVRFNTANIDTVSGATVTSIAVREAAQSAVDQILAAWRSAPEDEPVEEEYDEYDEHDHEGIED